LEETATAGIVSAKGRTLPGDGYVPFIQTDAAVNPGNSGGPLFDANGAVVGINAQIYSNSGGYQGVSFAIPINLAVQVKDQIVKTGKVAHARLGRRGADPRSVARRLVQVENAERRPHRPGRGRAARPPKPDSRSAM
jgi:S1-C subfamily serine protease